MTQRVGDFSHQSHLTDLMSATRSRVRAMETSVASGKSISRFSEIPSETGQLLRTRAQAAGTSNFIRQNERLGDQLQATDGALGDIVAVAERLRSLLVQRLNDPTGGDVPLDTEAQSMAEEVAARLNVSSGGRFLFAGTATDRKPVVLPSAPTTNADPAIYYRGDAINRSANIEEEIQIDLIARADDPAFADLLSALGSASVGHLTDDRPTLEAALTKAERALSGVVALRSRVAATTARVADVAESQRTASLYLDETRSRIEDTDIAKTMTQLAQDKTAIEASYLIVSQISNLSLTDYLR